MHRYWRGPLHYLWWGRPFIHLGYHITDTLRLSYIMIKVIFKGTTFLSIIWHGVLWVGHDRVDIVTIITPLLYLIFVNMFLNRPRILIHDLLIGRQTRYHRSYSCSMYIILLNYLITYLILLYTCFCLRLSIVRCTLYINNLYLLDRVVR